MTLSASSFLKSSNQILSKMTQTILILQNYSPNLKDPSQRIPSLSFGCLMLLFLVCVPQKGFDSFFSVQNT